MAAAVGLSASPCTAAILCPLLLNVIMSDPKTLLLNVTFGLLDSLDLRYQSVIRAKVSNSKESVFLGSNLEWLSMQE